MAVWCAHTLANTFVKYGPNAFLVLLKGILATMKVDNEWMEALKSLATKKHPELMNYEEFQKIIKEELPKSDELYYELRDIYDKWKAKYAPKDEMTYKRLGLLETIKSSAVSLQLLQPINLEAPAPIKTAKVLLFIASTISEGISGISLIILHLYFSQFHSNIP